MNTPNLKRWLTAAGLAVGLAAPLAVAGAATSTAHEAEAAAGRWVPFNVQSTDRCTADYWVWLNASGYYDVSVAGGVYFDFNNDCKYDSFARDMSGDGSVDEFWYDHEVPGGTWDALVIGNTRWEKQVSSGWTGPYGSYWARMGDFAATIGGTKSNATGSGFYQLMTTLADRSGITIWPDAMI